MNKRYKVVFYGLHKAEDYFKERMLGLGVPSSTAEIIIQKTPVILKDGMSHGKAWRYAEAIRHAGGRVNIQKQGFYEEAREEGGSLTIEPLENFTMCPQCGHKQLKTEPCEKCGLIFKEG